MRQDILEKLKKITPEEQAILNGAESIDKEIYNLNRSTRIDCDRLLKKGKLIEVRPHTRFVRFPKHTHNYIEVVYMCMGSTRHIIDGDEVILKSGELLFLSQNAFQEIDACSADDVAINFIILPEFFDRSLDMINREQLFDNAGMHNNMMLDFLIDCLRNKNQEISYLHFKVADVLPVQNLIENLVYMVESDQPNKRSLSQTTMGLLLLHLLNYTDKVEARKSHPEQEIIWAVLRFIEEQYRDGELSALAAELNQSLYGLSRLIKSMTGKTYTELLQEKRLNQAVYLLKNTDLSITDICLDVGYNNFSYFYRIFKSRFGMSPKKFRL